jgi:hypothetical protein
MLKLNLGDFLQVLLTEGIISATPVADLHSGSASPIFTADQVYYGGTSFLDWARVNSISWPSDWV